MNDNDPTRRQILKNIAIMIPASALIASTRSFAAEMPHVDTSDPMAKALAYVHDGADVDKSNPAFARFEAGQTCAGCAQIQPPTDGDWVGCAIFPGKSVNAKGWCSVWVAKS